MLYIRIDMNYVGVSVSVVSFVYMISRTKQVGRCPLILQSCVISSDHRIDSVLVSFNIFFFVKYLLESSLDAFWIVKDAEFLYADNEDSDQTARKGRLI